MEGTPAGVHNLIVTHISSSWSELSHMITPKCKGSWDILFFRGICPAQKSGVLLTREEQNIFCRTSTGFCHIHGLRCMSLHMTPFLSAPISLSASLISAASMLLPECFLIQSAIMAFPCSQATSGSLLPRKVILNLYYESGIT